jgi:hypothetical protein
MIGREHIPARFLVASIVCLFQISFSQVTNRPTEGAEVHRSPLPRNVLELQTSADLTNAHYFLMLGYSLYTNRSFQEAVVPLSKAVNLEPTNYEANLWLAL